MDVLQPLRELGTPLADISGPTPFADVNSAFDPFFPMPTQVAGTANTSPPTAAALPDHVTSAASLDPIS